MKETVIQNVKIAVCGILTLLLLFLTVMELIPSEGSPVTVEEEITASSALIDTASGTYENAVSGMIRNDGGAPISIDSLTVTLRSGDETKDVVLSVPDVIPARTSYSVAASVTDTKAYNEVEAITVVIGGEAYALSNAVKPLIGGGLLILIGLLLIVGYFLYRSILVRYYMHQEAKIKA